MTKAARPNQNKLRRLNARLQQVVLTSRFGRAYAIFSVMVLLATTLLWSFLGSNLQMGNADQLADPYLFEHQATFKEALFPGAHSFLIKWPLFLLIKLFGPSAASFNIFTAVTVLATVGFLAVILYRLEKRPIIFGTLCLALASTMLLVPAQPYAGALLPVNMAMVATRNIEYVLYILSLAILIKSPRLKSKSFWTAGGLLGLLVASDKLFLTLAVGGALLALTAYVIRKNRGLVSASIKWLMAGLVAAVVATALLWAVNASGITHIVTETNAAPYSLNHDVRQIALGIIYVPMGLATNFGANPAFDATIVRNIPGDALTRILSLSGFSYLVNLAILTGGIFIVWRLLAASLVRRSSAATKLDSRARLSIMLIWTSLAALAAFVFTIHYYAVDARYLTISFFAIFISAGTYLSTKAISVRRAVIVGSIFCLSIILGLVSVSRSYTTNKAVLDTFNQRNQLIAQALSSHPVKVLVGDYWRVIPAKFESGNKLNIMPLSDCSQPRDILSSRQWRVNLRSNSFAYLLSEDKSLTNYPGCSLGQVIDLYGRPNSSILIAGTVENPREQLLIYDHGAHKSNLKTQPKTPGTVLPISTAELPNTACGSPTIVNVVAHQDDDLLFMNPDIYRDIQAGRCVRTIYMTAGDAGADKFYWLKREQGSQAAYSKMSNASTIWINKIVRLDDHSYITVSSPRGNPRVSLIFMHLPDGNVRGQGFRPDRGQSLAKLENGRIPAIDSVDGQSSYSPNEVVSALATLMNLYNAAGIKTLANYASATYPDHSDHMAVSRFTKAAWLKYQQSKAATNASVPITYYLGYPVHNRPQNVTGTDLMVKETVWFAYAKYDDSVCGSLDCPGNPVYGIYIKRQYTSAE